MSPLLQERATPAAAQPLPLGEEQQQQQLEREDSDTDSSGEESDSDSSGEESGATFSFLVRMCALLVVVVVASEGQPLYSGVLCLAGLVCDVICG